MVKIRCTRKPLLLLQEEVEVVFCFDDTNRERKHIVGNEAYQRQKTKHIAANLCNTVFYFFPAYLTFTIKIITSSLLVEGASFCCNTTRNFACVISHNQHTVQSIKKFNHSAIIKFI